MQTLAAHPARSLSKDSQSILILVAEPEIAKPSVTRIGLSGTSKQTGRALAVMPRHRHEFVQDPGLVRTPLPRLAPAQGLKQLSSCRRALFPHSCALRTIRLGNILDEETDPSQVSF
ncbi:MAG: hypothetical protein F4Z55_05510 [Boseongicola sp. SB0667_bin_21]|nr:hypothetical protein [Boseongicola sp. SB0667_bin_21]